MKKLIVILVVVIALACAGLLTFILQVKPSELKQVLSAEVQAKTGRQFTIDGPMKWHFWPKLGLSAQNLSLRDDPDFRQGNLVTIGQMDVAVSPWGLLARHLELGKIELSDVTFHWVRLKDGYTNVQSLLADIRRASGGFHTLPLRSSWSITAQGLEVKKASLNIDDNRTNRHVQIAPLDLSIGKLTTEQTRPIQATYQFNDGKLNFFSQLQGAIRITDNWHQWSINDFTQTYQFHGAAAEQGLKQATIIGSVNYNSSSKHLSLRPLAISVNQQASIDGELNVDWSKRPIAVNFNATASQLTLPAAKLLLNRLGSYHDPLYLDVKADGQIKADDLQIGQLHLANLLSQVNFDQGMLTFKQATADFYDGNLTANMGINLVATHPVFNMSADIAGVTSQSMLKSTCQQSPIQGTVRISAQLEGQTPLTELTQMKGRIQVAMQNAMLVGIDLVHFKAEGHSELSQLSGRAQFDGNQLLFDSLQLSLNDGTHLTGKGTWDPSGALSFSLNQANKTYQIDVTGSCVKPRFTITP
ncbi:AsmA family protein [Celerinatantimonas yamalensis]|uniref:AsmA family protein n=1 Tax=Celerinatantimonas yamalensis TaxID=559956 RepID=A0ABW9G358_9GAMM